MTLASLRLLVSELQDDDLPSGATFGSVFYRRDNRWFDLVNQHIEPNIGMLLEQAREHARTVRNSS